MIKKLRKIIKKEKVCSNIEVINELKLNFNNTSEELSKIKQQIQELKATNENLTSEIEKLKIKKETSQLQHNTFSVTHYTGDRKLYVVVVGCNKINNDKKTVISRISKEYAETFKLICEQHYEETGLVYRVKSNNKFISISNEDLITREEALDLIENYIWSKDLKWVNCKVYYKNQYTGIDIPIINDIQSLKVNGHSLNGVYTELYTRYGHLNSTAVRLIYENTDKQSFKEFYNKGRC